jgi:hypothetical protein
MRTTWAPSSVNIPKLVMTQETMVFKNFGRAEKKAEAKNEITTRKSLESNVGSVHPDHNGKSTDEAHAPAL